MRMNSQPASRTQTFRSSHNSKYHTREIEINDQIMTSSMLGGKTYYTALKDSVFMKPQNHTYQRDKVPETARSEAMRSFASPALFDSKMSRTSKRDKLEMSTFHASSPQRFYYLGRHREQLPPPDTKKIVSEIFDGSKIEVNSSNQSAMQAYRMNSLDSSTVRAPKTSQGQRPKLLPVTDLEGQQ